MSSSPLPRVVYNGEIGYKYDEERPLWKEKVFQDIADISWNIFREDIIPSKLNEAINELRLWGT